MPSAQLAQWQQLDATVKAWWNSDLARATEKEVRADHGGQLLFVPFPYLTAFGQPQQDGTMYAWDSDFMSRGAMVHGREELVRNHITNYLSLIDRYGFMPNGNVGALLTRSQTPLIADTVWRLYQKTKDRDLLYLAYPRLKKNYRDYWTSPHHQTPTGLATNRDLGDPTYRPELAAEAETGLDWTPIFAGDVRRCVPLITNCALVRYARQLTLMAREIGIGKEAVEFQKLADTRADLIRHYCWNEAAGYFLEYDYVSGKQLPYISDCAYWTLWSGVATRDQARRLAGNLRMIEQSFGLSCTDKTYDPPLPLSAYEPPGVAGPDGRAAPFPGIPAAAVGGQGELQWMYPAGWAPTQLMPIEGLDAYGYGDHAKRIASKFLALLLDQYQRTGHLWEKYNVVDGTFVLPNSRYGSVPDYGWTMAAAALLGRRVFYAQSLQTI